MPERGNQALVGTGILWISVDRVCRGCDSTVDVAEQKVRRDKSARINDRDWYCGSRCKMVSGAERLRRASSKDGDASQELVRDYSRGIERNCALHLF